MQFIYLMVVIIDEIGHCAFKKVQLDDQTIYVYHVLLKLTSHWTFSHGAFLVLVLQGFLSLI